MSVCVSVCVCEYKYVDGAVDAAICDAPFAVVILEMNAGIYGPKNVLNLHNHQSWSELEKNAEKNLIKLQLQNEF